VRAGLRVASAPNHAAVAAPPCADRLLLSGLQRPAATRDVVPDVNHETGDWLVADRPTQRHLPKKVHPSQAVLMAATVLEAARFFFIAPMNVLQSGGNARLQGP